MQIAAEQSRADDLKFNFSMNLNSRYSQFSQLINGFSFTLLFLLSVSYTAAQPQPPANQPPPVPPDIAPNFKVSPSMAVILVCLFSAFFLMGCVSITVRQCADRRVRLAIIAAGGVGSGRRSADGNGLDRAVVESFPVFLFSDVKRHRIGSGTLECAVCLNEFESDESLRLLPKCSHAFHPDCIDSWLVSHVTCPVCRADLVPRPGDPQPAPLLLHDSDNESTNSEPDGSAYDVIISIESPQVINPTLTPNRNRPPRSGSKKSPVSNFDRFTLRLPEEVKFQLMNPSLIRTRSCMTFTTVQSSRKGYRSRSVGGSTQSEWWNNVMKTPSIFSRLSSSRSPKPGFTAKSPLRIVDNVDPGERSFQRLKPGL